MADAIPLTVFLFAAHSYWLFFNTQWQNSFHHQPRNGKDVWTQPVSQLFLIVRLRGTQQAHSFENAKASVLLHTSPLDAEGSVSGFLFAVLLSFKKGRKQFETTPEWQLLLAGQKDARHSALPGLSQNMQFVRRNCAFIDGIANLIHF